MPKTWKHLSGALGAMILGSLVTGVVMTSPGFMRNDPGAQDAAFDQVAGPAGDAAGQFATSTPLQGQNLDAAEGLSSAFRKVAELMRPSVVSITTKATEVVGGNRLPPGLPPEMERFFGGGGAPREREATGTGSGVIVRSDGYILTNNHVVEGADELEVEFSDGTTIAGRIIGTDPQTDLAVVKVERNDLKAAALGDSDAIKVGDWVVAIGSPFGLDQTVTAGIISGKNRIRGIVGDGAGFEDFLQTDAAINPGNSGGPLVNLRGELVGINTAIMSRSGSSAGIGFAIPVSLAGPVLRSIIENGTVRRGFLGASLGPVNQKTIEGYGLKVNKGVMIETVLEEMPAAEAGIQPGDVVIAIDGRPMKTSAQMRNYVASRPPGATMSMDVNRDGKSMKVNVHLKERTEEVMAQFGSGEVMGAELVPVTEATAKKYGYRNLEAGLIITGIKDDSIAERDGLMVGDVIESAGGLPLSSARQLKAILDEYQRQSQPCRVSIRRGTQRLLMVVRD